MVRESTGNEPASCRGNTGAGMTGMKTGRGRADCGLDAAPALPEFQSRWGAGPLDGPSPRSPWSPYSLLGPALIFVPRPTHGRCPLVTCYLRDPEPRSGHRGSREAGFRVQIPVCTLEKRGASGTRGEEGRGEWEEPGAGRRVDAERRRGPCGGSQEPLRTLRWGSPPQNSGESHKDNRRCAV